MQTKRKIEYTYSGDEKLRTLTIRTDVCLACLYWYLDDTNNVYISNVFVLKSARNRGIGNLLLELAELIAYKNGFKYIYLWTKENTIQHEWYQRKKYLDLKISKKKHFTWMVKKINT